MKFSFTKTIVPILTSLFIIYFLYRAYTYLGGLKSCVCAPKLYVDRLKILEVIYIALSIISIIAILLSTTFSKIITMNGKIITSIFAIALLAIYLLFIYNAYEFQRNLDGKCECALDMSRIIIYIQAIMYSIPLIIFLLRVLEFGDIAVLVIITIALSLDLFHSQQKTVSTTTSPMIFLNNNNGLSKTPEIVLNAPMPM